MSLTLRTASPRARAVLALGIVAIGAIVLLACGGTSAANTGTTNTTSTNTSAPKAAQHFKVGDQVKVGDTYVITVNSVKTSNGDDFIKPKDGNTFLIVDLTIKNVSSKEQNVSSILSFNLKDSTGQKYTETFVSGATAPDGKIEAGDVLRGQIPYEVPTAQHDFNLSFEADLLSAGQTVWNLHI